MKLYFPGPDRDLFQAIEIPLDMLAGNRLTARGISRQLLPYQIRDDFAHGTSAAQCKLLHYFKHIVVNIKGGFHGSSIPHEMMDASSDGKGVPR
jgi:hypothetical protein